MTKEEKVYCSFCAKCQDDVEQIIAGPAVYICNECTDLCVAICAEARGKRRLAFPTATEAQIAAFAGRIADEVERRLALHTAGAAP